MTANVTRKIAPPLMPLAKVMATVLMIANNIAGAKTNTLKREPRMMPATNAKITIAANIRSAPYRQAITLAAQPIVTNALPLLVFPPDAEERLHDRGQKGPLQCSNPERGGCFIPFFCLF
jgi:hypothetical protein